LDNGGTPQGALPLHRQSIEVGDQSIEIADRSLKKSHQSVEIGERALKITRRPLKIAYQSLEVADRPLKKSDRSLEIADRPLKKSDRPVEIGEQSVEIAVQNSPVQPKNVLMIVPLSNIRTDAADWSLPSPLAAHPVKPLRETTLLQKHFFKAGYLAVQQAARYREQRQRAVGRDFWKSGLCGLNGLLRRRILSTLSMPTIMHRPRPSASTPQTDFWC
jgi:hypothetical protein